MSQTCTSSIPTFFRDEKIRTDHFRFFFPSSSFACIQFYGPARSHSSPPTCSSSSPRLVDSPSLKSTNFTSPEFPLGGPLPGLPTDPRTKPMKLNASSSELNPPTSKRSTAATSPTRLKRPFDLYFAFLDYRLSIITASFTKNRIIQFHSCIIAFPTPNYHKSFRNLFRNVQFSFRISVIVRRIERRSEGLWRSKSTGTARDQV